MRGTFHFKGVVCELRFSPDQEWQQAAAEAAELLSIDLAAGGPFTLFVDGEAVAPNEQIATTASLRSSGRWVPMVIVRNAETASCKWLRVDIAFPHMRRPVQYMFHQRKCTWGDLTSRAVVDANRPTTAYRFVLVGAPAGQGAINDGDRVRGAPHVEPNGVPNLLEAHVAANDGSDDFTSSSA